MAEPSTAGAESHLRLAASSDSAEFIRCDAERGLLERKFEAAFAASPDPMSISRIEDGSFIEVNRAFERWSGYTREEVLGNSSLSLGLWIHPEQRDATMNRLVTPDSASENIVDLRLKSGEHRRVSLSASFFSHDGKSYLLCLTHDVTEREKVDQELRLNKDRLECLQKLNQMTDATLREISSYALEEAVRLTQSKIGYVAFLNEDETVMTMQAWSKSAMAECSVENRTIVYPVESTGLWGEAVRQRRPVVTNDYTLSTPGKKGLPQGHVGLSRHMNVPVFDGQRIVMVAGVGNKNSDYDDSDVRQLSLMMNEVWRMVQRNKTQSALRSRQTLLDSILQSTADGILVVGSSGEVLATNHRFQDMWKIPDELLLSGNDELLLSHVLEQVSAPADFVAEVNRIYSTNTESWSRVEFKDGRIFERYSRAIPQYGKRSRLWSFRDITERARAEDALRQAQKMDSIGQLAGGVAHDFNNMLGGIIGAAEMLKSRVPLDQESSSLIEMLLDSSTRAAELTQQLLVFSRKAPVRLCPVDIHKAILNVVHILERSVDKRIRISWIFCDESVTVRADQYRLETSFLNLALNARDAMQDGGDLRFVTRTVEFNEKACKAAGLPELPGEYVQISVVDTGCGISSENLDKIFDPFFTTKPVGKGTGLGLSVVYGVVKEHGGSIRALSVPGRGTEFRLLFPVIPDQPVMEVSAEAELKIPVGRTILLVEDEPVMRRITQTIMENAGLRVLVAKDGKEAVDMYSRLYSEIDLVLLDMVLPYMSGRDAFLAMKLINPDVCAIFASGYTREGPLADLIEEGSVKGFLQKPFRKSELMALLCASLSVPA